MDEDRDHLIKRQNETVAAAIAVMAASFAIIASIRTLKHIPREPHVNKDKEREKYLDGIINGRDYKCIQQLRLSKRAFYGLCDVLKEKRFLRDTIHISVEQQLAMFLHTIGHNVRNRVISCRYFRSSETVWRYFNIVLHAILGLKNDYIHGPAASTPSKIRNSQTYWPWFKDCIGVIYGTHVRASLPIDIQARFRGRKDRITQNVMAAVGFDLKFTYVLVGWEGSAHDSIILDDALTRRIWLIVPEDKYYLVDAGYGVRKGIIPPYRGVRYHLKEYSDHQPQNEKELFNLRHSKLRNSIERAFGILKKRFRVLGAEPFWSYEKQVDVVLACCILHNYIMGVDPNDRIVVEFDQDMQSETQPQRRQRTQREQREENREWTQKRDEIAHVMYEDYLHH